MKLPFMQTCHKIECNMIMVYFLAARRFELCVCVCGGGGGGWGWGKGGSGESTL